MWRTGELKKEIQRGDIDAKGLEAVEFMSSALKHEMSNRFISFFWTSMCNAIGRINETSTKKGQEK